MNTTQQLPLVLLDRDQQNLHDVMLTIMQKIKEPVIFKPVSKNQLPCAETIRSFSPTVIDDVFDNDTLRQLKAISLQPIRYIRLKGNAPPPAITSVPGKELAFGGNPVVKTITHPEKAPEKKKRTTVTKPAVSLRMNPVIKKLTEPGLIRFIQEEYRRHDKELYTGLLARPLIIKYYGILFPTELDIDHVKKQLDAWVKQSDAVQYNPTRKKFRPKL